jgi:hypothetical protein
MDPQSFDPDDLSEMSSMFARIMSDSDQGYTMEFLSADYKPKT